MSIECFYERGLESNSPIELLPDTLQLRGIVLMDRVNFSMMQIHNPIYRRPDGLYDLFSLRATFMRDFWLWQVAPLFSQTGREIDGKNTMDSATSASSKVVFNRVNSL